MKSYQLWTVDHGPFKVQQLENTPQWTVYRDSHDTDCYAWALVPEQMRALVDVLKHALNLIEEDYQRSIKEEERA